MGRHPRYSEEEARAAVRASQSFSEALRRLGMRPAGGNHATLAKYVQLWSIPVDHFDPHRMRREKLRALRPATPLAEILVAGSTYHRGHLKRRLYEEGIKQRVCELCGQDEAWRGRRMALILDHINGDAIDNRIENLRVVCPNCAATLDTHCGKAVKRVRHERTCVGCGTLFYPAIGVSGSARNCATPQPRPRGLALTAAASSARPSTSFSARSRRRAGARSGGATASRTTLWQGADQRERDPA